MTSTSTEAYERTPGSLTAAVSQHVVRLMAEYTGRGPTKARTTIRDNIVVCVTENKMTKAERRLVQVGKEELVATLRRGFRRTMRDDLVQGVQLLTGRTVVSFLSDHDADTDHAVAVFVLDKPPELSAAFGPEQDASPDR